MRLSVGRRGTSLIALGATLVLSSTGLAFASTSTHHGQGGRAAFKTSSREVRAAQHFKSGAYIVVLEAGTGGDLSRRRPRVSPPRLAERLVRPACASRCGVPGLPGAASKAASPQRVLGRRSTSVTPSALNGFSAHLSATQARGLARDPRVLAVSRDRLVHTDRRCRRSGPTPPRSSSGSPTTGNRPPGWNPKTAGQGHRRRRRRLRHLAAEPGVRGHEAPAQEEGHRGQARPHLGRQHPQDRVPQGGRQDLPRPVPGGPEVPGGHLQQQADLGVVLRRRASCSSSRATRGRRPSSRPRVTASGTARTRPPPPRATTASRRRSTARTYGRITGIAPAAKIATYKALWATAADPAEASGATSDIAGGHRPAR